ncbi:MAG: hypothetical protein K2G03_04880 [Bacilli bacterium]|nr:hypothetical protein [Bacilli bacterium]MDE6141917.1 hypothetical protein [Bacilli bacterium]
MKRTKVLILCLFTLLIAGCSDTKTTVKPDEFLSVMGEFKLDVQDQTETVDYADAIYRVNSDTYDFIYIDGKKKYDIEGLFVDQCKNVVDDIGTGIGTYKQDTGSGSNWAKLEITTEDTYYYVSWIGDTYIYIKGLIADADMFRNIIKELGY